MKLPPAFWLVMTLLVTGLAASRIDGLPAWTVSMADFIAAASISVVHIKQ